MYVASGWHRWFAWHPVFVESKFVWLKNVDRQIEVNFLDCGDIEINYYYEMLSGKHAQMLSAKDNGVHEGWKIH